MVPPPRFPLALAVAMLVGTACSNRPARAPAPATAAPEVAPNVAPPVAVDRVDPALTPPASEAHDLASNDSDAPPPMMPKPITAAARARYERCLRYVERTGLRIRCTLDGQPDDF